MRGYRGAALRSCPSTNLITYVETNNGNNGGDHISSFTYVNDWNKIHNINCTMYVQDFNDFDLEFWYTYKNPNFRKVQTLYTHFTLCALCLPACPACTQQASNKESQSGNKTCGSVAAAARATCNPSKEFLFARQLRAWTSTLTPPSSKSPWQLGARRMHRGACAGKWLAPTRPEHPISLPARHSNPLAYFMRRPLRPACCATNPRFSRMCLHR